MHFEMFFPIVTMLLGYALPMVFKAISVYRTPEFDKSVELVISALDIADKAFPSYFDAPEVKWDDYVRKVATDIKSEEKFSADVELVIKAVLEKLAK